MCGEFWWRLVCELRITGPGQPLEALKMGLVRIKTCNASQAIITGTQCDTRAGLKTFFIKKKMATIRGGIDPVLSGALIVQVPVNVS
jgi:hypothetical protein